MLNAENIHKERLWKKIPCHNLKKDENQLREPAEKKNVMKKQKQEMQLVSNPAKYETHLVKKLSSEFISSIKDHTISSRLSAQNGDSMDLKEMLKTFDGPPGVPYFNQQQKQFDLSFGGEMSIRQQNQRVDNGYGLAVTNFLNILKYVQQHIAQLKQQSTLLKKNLQNYQIYYRNCWVQAISIYLENNQRIITENEHLLNQNQLLEKTNEENGKQLERLKKNNIYLQESNRIIKKENLQLNKTVEDYKQVVENLTKQVDVKIKNILNQYYYQKKEGKKQLQIPVEISLTYEETCNRTGGSSRGNSKIKKMYPNFERDKKQRISGEFLNVFEMEDDEEEKSKMHNWTDTTKCMQRQNSSISNYQPYLGNINESASKISYRDKIKQLKQNNQRYPPHTLPFGTSQARFIPHDSPEREKISPPKNINKISPGGGRLHRISTVKSIQFTSKDKNIAAEKKLKKVGSATSLFPQEQSSRLNRLLSQRKKPFKNNDNNMEDINSRLLKMKKELEAEIREAKRDHI